MSKPLHSIEYTHFLDELRAARARAGVSQTQLAELIGEDQTYVSKCETGIRRVDIVELKRWTEALGVELVDFARQFQERLDRNRPAGSTRTRRR